MDKKYADSKRTTHGNKDTTLPVALDNAIHEDELSLACLTAHGTGRKGGGGLCTCALLYTRRWCLHGLHDGHDLLRNDGEHLNFNAIEFVETDNIKRQTMQRSKQTETRCDSSPAPATTLNKTREHAPDTLVIEAV